MLWNCYALLWNSWKSHIIAHIRDSLQRLLLLYCVILAAMTFSAKCTYFSPTYPMSIDFCNGPDTILHKRLLGFYLVAFLQMYIHTKRVTIALCDITVSIKLHQFSIHETPSSHQPPVTRLVRVFLGRLPNPELPLDARLSSL